VSIVWTLRKLVDPIAHQTEEAQNERDRTHAQRQAVGDGDDGQGPLTGYECRVCGYQAGDGAYCPKCLADTMVDRKGNG
jgi:rubrerythrin